MVSRNLLKRGEVTPVNAYYNVPVQVKTMKFPAEYKFQDKENSKDISFWKWLWEDFIFVVFVHDRNIWHSGSATKWDTVPLTERDLDTSQGMQEPKRTTDEEIDGTRIGSTLQLPGKEPRMSHLRESSSTIAIGTKDDSNVIPDSSNICTNDNQVDQNVSGCVDERVALANLIANLTLDIEENKTVLKQLKKANASLTQELKECKTNLDESSRALGEATSSRDSSLIALQTKQTELEKYTALNDLTSEYKG
ncbi:hypothetical protein Tco_0054189 [Tanacetum coccineum]